MIEKISDASIRREKVKKLKEKTLSEIEKYSLINKKKIKEILTDEEFCYNNYVLLIKGENALIELRKFIDTHSFMEYYQKNEEDGLIIYTISDYILDIFLDEKYDFVGNYLNDMNTYHISNSVLQDEYLQTDFINIYDAIAYKKKLEFK